jgi:hypothetical protein
MINSIVHDGILVIQQVSTTPLSARLLYAASWSKRRLVNDVDCLLFYYIAYRLYLHLVLYANNNENDNDNTVNIWAGGGGLVVLRGNTISVDVWFWQVLGLAECRATPWPWMWILNWIESELECDSWYIFSPDNGHWCLLVLVLVLVLIFLMIVVESWGSGTAFDLEPKTSLVNSKKERRYKHWNRI